ncbi:hypothetical protein C1645_738679 [Glomus cerebriforme]|uniref:Uncharacterized protein n=1 Tax=Glomus cerebriforme TaxID=658196 RepID=A0A397SXL0_9GLOM|nr:hypothetical protein C1645_738679 [Glomus cerebriforme]
MERERLTELGYPWYSTLAQNEGIEEEKKLYSSQLESRNDTSSSSSKSTSSTYKEEETDRDEIQFDEPERAELASNIFKEDDDINTFFQTSSSRKLAKTGNKDEAVKMNKWREYKPCKCRQEKCTKNFAKTKEDVTYGRFYYKEGWKWRK